MENSAVATGMEKGFSFQPQRKEMAKIKLKKRRLRRGSRNTLKNYTKEGLNDPDNHDGVVTHLEPDILECEVRWALGSVTMNKATGGDGIPVKLLQILKDDAVKVLHSVCQQIWKTQQWPQVRKRSVFISIPKKGNAKECSNYHTIALISHSSKVTLKILQARLKQYLLTSVGSSKRQESSRKTSISALLTMPMPLTVWITINCGKV